VLGLNREELVGHRYKIYSTLELARVVFQSTDQALRQAAEGVLRDAMAPESDHAGMARYFILKKWKLAMTP
jgi:hypothetical protein